MISLWKKLSKKKLKMSKSQLKIIKKLWKMIRWRLTSNKKLVKRMNKHPLKFCNRM